MTWSLRFFRIQIRITDENEKRKQIAALEKELDEFEVKKAKLFRGWEDDVIDNETYKTRMKQYKEQIENTKVLIQHVGQESDEIEEQIELSLELMENHNSQWFTLKTARKGDIAV